MAITETLALKDGVSGPARAMGAAVSGLDRAAGKAQASLAKLGRGGSAFKPLNSTTGNAGKVNEKLGASLGKARLAMLKESAAAKFAARSTGQVGQAAKKAGGEVGELSGKKLLGGFVGPSMGLGILGVAMGVKAIGSAALAAARGAAELVYEFAKGVIEAKLLRDNAKAMQDTLSGGRGAAVMKLLHTQAIATGQSFDDLSKATTASRDAGLTYGEAFKLNKLRGDIIASGRSAEEADAAIGKMLAKVKAGGKTAAQAQAELAKKFKVVGDGAKAADKASTSLGGALERLKAAPGNIFAKVAEKSGPALDALGAKVSKLLNDFNKSDAAAGLIAGLARAMDLLVAGVEVALALAGPLWEGFKEGVAPLTAMIEPIGKALSVAFGGDAKDQMSGLATAAQMLGRAIGLIATAVIAPIVGLIAIGAAVGKVLGWFESLKTGAANAAAGLISGLAEGITNGISRVVQAAKDLADKVKATVKSALKIGSPSKVFAEMGRFTAQGMATGIERGTPAVAAAGQQMAAAPVAQAAATPRGGGSGAGGKSTSAFNLTLNISANPGATAEDGKALASGIVPTIRREIDSWFESRLLEAGA